MQFASIAFSIIILLSGVAFNGVKKTAYRSQPKQTVEDQIQDQDNTAKVLSFSTNTFIYPNSKIISQTESEAILESADSPETITEWYQQKIKEEGFNVKNFVKTKVNRNIENKLLGANKDQKIEIEITKKEGSTTTKIFIR